MKTYIGIDNGVTGTIGIINDLAAYFMNTPIKKEQDYTKKKQLITRIDTILLKQVLLRETYTNDVFVGIERPMINPNRWRASVSAIRADEAMRILLQTLDIPYQYIDSKEWQKMLLPKSTEKEDLKKASIDVATRLFPKLRGQFKPDADGLLIAEYCRRKNF